MTIIASALLGFGIGNLLARGVMDKDPLAFIFGIFQIAALVLFLASTGAA